jgi:hypothetical protein
MKQVTANSNNNKQQDLVSDKKKSKEENDKGKSWQYDCMKKF